MMQAVRRGLIRNLLIVPLLAGGFYVAGCKGDAKTKVETPKSQEVAGQWHGNRQAAISLTYDDGMATQFQHTFSALRRYNLKATFYLSGQSHDFSSLSRSCYFSGSHMGRA